MAKLFSIGIFDDHPIITSGLTDLLIQSGNFSVDLVANTRDSLLDQLALGQIDVLLMDVVVPDVSGLELFKVVCTRFPGLKVIAYTSLTSPILVENLFIHGVHGYLNKRQSATEVTAAILQVCMGRQYVPEEFEYLLERESGVLVSVNLTPREHEILLLVLDGKLSKEIASLLDISQNTVENHRTNLFRKFEVANLAELFKQAARLGYLRE